MQSTWEVEHCLHSSILSACEGPFLKITVQVRSAGLEFRVPTSAVSELPHFSSAGPSLQKAGTLRSAEGHERRWFEFAPRRVPR